MKIYEILKIFKNNEIELWSEVGKLKYRGRTGTLTPELKSVLVENRKKILDYFENIKNKTEDINPLSFNQQSLWFVHQFDPNCAAYNIGAACRIVSSVDKNSLGRALKRLIQCHSVLRTSYFISPKDSILWQKADGAIEPSIDSVDASLWQEDEVRIKVESYYRHAFDLESGPVIRLYLFNRKPEDYILLIVVHHIACDLWSLRIILEDLFRYYESELNGLAIVERSSPSYVKFVEEQHAIMAGEQGEALLKFWKNKLGDVPPFIELPLDFERPKVQKLVGSSYFFNIQGETYYQLKQFAKTSKTTLACLMLSLFNLVLHKYSGQTVFVVGMPAASRKNRKFHQTCGYFVNPVMIPSKINTCDQFQAYLSEISSTMFECLEHQEYPFSLLIEKLLRHRQTDRSPGFQVMFNMLSLNALGTASFFLCDNDTNPQTIGSLKVLPYPIAQQEGQYEMTLEFLDANRQLQGVLKYNTDLFTEKTVKEFIDNYLNLAKTINAKFLISVGDILSDITVSHSDRKSVVLAGTYTIELIEDVLSFWLRKLNLNFNVEFGPYNQIFQLLLDPGSALNKNKDGINVLLIRVEDWVKDQFHEEQIILPPLPEQVEELRKNTHDFIHILSSLAQNSSLTFIVCICPSSLKLRAIDRWARIIGELETEILENLKSVNSAYVVSPKEIFDLYPVEKYDEPLTDKIAHIPYTQAFFVSIGTTIARKIFALNSFKYKVVVVDCDNTLWDGVVGEDGIFGVTIDDSRKLFQNFLVDQCRSGRLLCLCSKNNESDVRDVFERHPDMVLKWIHIASYAINWNPKSQNIKALAKELNLGSDSFIFIDDSPIECGEIQAQCPEVLTIQMPASKAVDLSQFFKHIWSFDIIKTTSEDISRSEFYIKDRERKELQKTSVDYAAFIKGLDLKIDIELMQPSQLSRVAQLTQRTNQFNSTKIVRSESDIQNKCSSKSGHSHSVRLKDRFGDYGLVGVMISEQKANSLEIDSLLLSCRALGRGVEHHMLAYAGRFAISQDLEFVNLLYRPTDRNQPALAFLDSVGKDFVKNVNSEIVYQIPSIIASSITFSPQGLSAEAIASSDMPSKKKTKSSSSTISKEYQRLIIDIAENFNHTSDIERKVYNKSLTESTASKAGFGDRDIKSILKSIYMLVLKQDGINLDDNFFEIGGKSILIPLIVLQLKKNFNINITIVDVLRYPTISSLAAYIVGQNALQILSEPILDDHKDEAPRRKTSTVVAHQDIAIIGLAGRFPGADDIYEFWDNIINGKDTISTFSDDECLRSGVPEEILRNPEFVHRGGVVRGPDLFDASFFGYSPIEAQYIDPQQRMFLECAWHALEHAGYNSEDKGVRIGIYAGCGINYYLMKNLLGNRRLMEDVINPMTFFGNDKDFLTTRVSYKLNLKGPSVDVQSACSTSLVAVQLACQALLADQCDMVLCGGVSLQTPRMKGYLYQEGHILSKDGFCRAFDESASGTVFGEGAGILVLKRFEDAINDRDTIHAIIKGIAVNNDGSNKVGFTAPSVDGQAAVIEEALDRAGIASKDITYIESHGTGTQLGDPIEIMALAKVFAGKSPQERSCAIGSVKPNIGHLDVAAGVTGIIKTTLALKQRMIPPLIHLKKENPNLEIEKTPFFFPIQAQEWISNRKSRIAGVSSFGIGGTNAHAILAEAPNVETSESSYPSHLLLLSAKTITALDQMAQNLINHVAINRNTNLADVAYTLMIGRKHHAYRKFVVCSGINSALENLKAFDMQSSSFLPVRTQERHIIFMFSGQGTQYLNMGKELYAKLTVYKNIFDRCADILVPLMNLDIRKIIFTENEQTPEDVQKLNETYITQPVLFCVEYAFAKFLMHCGIHPALMIGHSIGEYVAACLSGVFSLEDALKLVSIRGRLMQEQPAGAMLAVSMSEKEIVPFLNEDISIAAVNSPKQCVLSGPIESIDNLQKRLEESVQKKVPIGRLKTSHAFHSKMMIPAAASLMDVMRDCRFNKPMIPYMSNVTGGLITERQAMNPKYWADHLTGTVRFSEGVNTLLSEPKSIIIEVGPGLVLTNLVRQHLRQHDDILLLSSIRHRDQNVSDFSFMLKTLGAIWTGGGIIDWRAFYQGESHMRIPLPLYPFERKSFWIASDGIDAIERSPIIANKLDRVKYSSIEFEALPEIANIRTTKQSGNKPPIPADADASLMSIWKNVLGYKNINSNDNFFEIGGSSLMAVALFDKIESAFGIRLPLATLYEAPTLKEMSLLLKSTDYIPSWNSLVSINEGNKKLSPFFCVHAEGGNVLEYRLLSKYIGGDKPFYGIQAKGLQGESVVEDSIEEMAASYIKELKTVQPHGPYFIGGYCLGGLVAYEIAQQLINEGEPIALLLLISNATPDQMRRTVPRLTKIKQMAFKLLERIELEADNLSGMSSREKKNHIMDRMIRLRISLQTNFEELIDKCFAALGLRYNWHSRTFILKKSVTHTNLAYAVYEPRPISCPIHLIKVTKPLRGREIVLDEYWGWDVYAQNGIKKYLVKAFHKNMLRDPNVQELSKVVGKLLQEAYRDIGNKMHQ